VVVHALNLLAYDPPYLLLHVHCETGTYVRALARDIGRALGCGAYCHALRRTAVGRFCLGDAWTLEELAAEPLHERWPQIAFHPDIALRDRPAAILSEADVRKWYHGRPVGPYSAGTITGDLVRVYGAAGQFLGVAEGAADGTLKPVMVFTAEGEG
jgi:tRNA pseudouridine55 synthase